MIISGKVKVGVLGAVACLLLAVVPSAQAYIVVNVDSSSGAYLENGGTGWGFPTFTAGDAVVNSLIQVIWSMDAVMGEALPGGTIAADDGDTDVVLYEGTTTAFGMIDEEPTNAGIQLTNTTGEDNTTFLAGYVYLRVFNTAARWSESIVSRTSVSVGHPLVAISNTSFSTIVPHR